VAVDLSVCDVFESAALKERQEEGDERQNDRAAACNNDGATLPFLPHKLAIKEHERDLEEYG
jgi:hypothetical protein